MTVGYVAILQRSPLFRRLFFGALISALGDVLTWMALLWHVTETTGSGAKVGFLLLCFGLPATFSGGPIGKLLDRVQPRTVMVVDNVLRAGLIALVPLFDRLGVLSFPLLCVVAALSGALAPATRVGLGVIVPRLIDEGDRVAANAAIAFCEQAAVVIGPAVAGRVIAAVGAPYALLVDALSFLAMAGALAAIPDVPRETKAEAGEKRASWRDLTHPALFLATALSAVGAFAYGPSEAAIPLLVKQTFQGEAGQLGQIWSAVGVGAVLGGLATPLLARWGRIGWFLGLSMVLWGIFQWAMAQMPTVLLASACFLLGGMTWGPYIPLKMTLFQRLVPEERLGAALGAQSAILAPALPLGTALGGFLLRDFTPPTVIGASGLACTVAGLLALCVPALRAIGKKEDKS